jgi:RNA polymerase sigma-70 factor (ECF subfamily)
LASQAPSKADVSVVAQVSGPEGERERERPELDGAALVAAQRGERWARRALVVTYQARVHALTWRLMAGAGRRDQAEDLVQEAFLRVFRALPRFSAAGPARLSTWILTIATRAVIDELRRRAPGQAVVPVALDELPGGERPDLHSEQRSVGRAIARAVASLSPEVRAAFVLRAYHDMGYGEIAEALDVGVGTVKSRLWRARAALQQHLHEVHGEQGR